MAIQTSASFQPGGNISEHIASELLLLAKKSLIIHQLAEPAKMPAGEGQTFQFNRYERLRLPLNPLSEGVDPASSDMALSTVQATADQWGAYVDLSDVAQLTIKHPLLQVAIELLGYQAAELVERETIDVLMDSTSVTYGGANTVRSGMTDEATDSFVDSVAQKVVKRLRDRGAHERDDNYFVGVVDTAMEQDISQAANSSFTQAAAYSSIRTLYRGEIGTWRGTRWLCSNFIAPIEGVAAVSATSPDDPAGTFATDNYRIAVAHYDALTGQLVKLSQNSAVAFTNNDSLALTTPNDEAYVYKVFVGLADGGANDIMYQGIATAGGSGFLAHNTAVSVLAPPTSGLSIAGSEIPASGKIVHFGWVFGRQAFANVDLQNLQVMVSKPEASDSNPLLLRRTVGWKVMFKPVIQNNAFLERIEVLSQFD